MTRQRLTGLASLVLVTLMSSAAYAVNLDSYIEWLIRQECKVQGVDADLAISCARIESRKLDRHGNVTQKYRIGRLGKSPYFGPGGIKEGLKWPYDYKTLHGNIKCHVMVLKRPGTVYQVLRGYYGEGMPEKYYKAVLTEMRKCRKELNHD